MKIPRHLFRHPWFRILRILTVSAVSVVIITGCGTHSPHRGRLPFSLMEKPPKGTGQDAMTLVLEHHQTGGVPSEATLAGIHPGDVIAFHMSHREAWKYLQKGTVQKLPYELLRYGHIALVVPDPEMPKGSPDLKLLQIAMKQAANTTETLDYLKDKSWHVYRPPTGKVSAEKLREFSKKVTEIANDPKKAYDYPSVIGIRNLPSDPERIEEIGDQYSCASLVVAGLHYSGYRLQAVRRNGYLDLVTPRQVVESSAR